MAHGGTIVVADRPGGARFEVRLPATDPVTDLAPEAATQTAAGPAADSATETAADRPRGPAQPDRMER